MKRLLLLLCLVFSMVSVNAQEKHSYYIKVWMLDGSVFKPNPIIGVADLGINSENPLRTICKSDSTYEFCSKMEVLNFLANFGWEVVDKGRESFYGVAIYEYFIMKRIAYTLEEAVAELLPMDSRKVKELKKAKKKKKAEERRKEFDESGADSMYY